MSDETRVQAPAPGAGLREAVEALARRLETEPCPVVPFLQISAADYRDGWERAQTEDARQLRHILVAHPAPTDDAPRDGEAAERRTEGLSVVERAAMILGRDGNPPQLGAAMALADAGLLVSEDARGALDETLDDLTRALARAEKAEAALREVAAKVRREMKNYYTRTQNEGFEVALNIIYAALSDTTGEASR